MRNRTNGPADRAFAPAGFPGTIAFFCGSLLPGPMGTVSAEPQRAGVVDMLVQRSERQAKLFNAGQMQTWLELVNLSADFTLMQPFGGPATRGFDPTPERMAELAASFQNGDATLELVQAITSPDLVVLVYVERQDGEVLGLPKQDWSLRVTQVFQRIGPDWQLVHRHADPLVRPLTLETTAALAAGRELVEMAAE